MDDEKVYVPQTISENPFPQEAGVVSFAPSQTTGNDTYSPQVTQNQTPPTKRIAVELIGSALNTKSRKILQKFEFTKNGAIQVGEYENGVSGDVRISPIGITARNQSGLTTFALDGDTGDATFLGTVQSGSLIAGSVISDSAITGDITVGGVNNGSGEIHVLDNTDVERITMNKDGVTINNGKLTIKDANDSTIIDANGLSTANFPAGYVTDVNSQNTSSTSLVDVTNMSLTFTLAKSCRVLIFASLTGGASSNSGYMVQAIINLDGAQRGGSIILPGHEWGGGIVFMTGATQTIESLTSGSHTIKLQFLTTGGTGYISSNTKILGYLVLGK